MSKHILQLVLVAVCLLNSAIARGAILDAGEAREVAADFFRSSGVSRLADIGSLTLAHTEGSSSAPTYYVFNATDGEGFIIIAADDSAVPVIGYSYDTIWRNENAPVYVTAMLRQNTGILSAPSYEKRSPVASVAGSKLLQTAQWSQEAPFNNMIPNRRLAGCVGTALAEILKYHSYPLSRPRSLTMENEAQEYMWDMMRDDNYRNGYSAEEADAVAAIVADAAVSIGTDFGMSSSSAFEVRVPGALVDVFGYDPSVSYKKHSEIDRQTWDDIIVNEINEGRPVLYSGQDMSAGHAFVCDGYEYNGGIPYFHINWGWGGGANGYYASDALNPTLSGSHSFNDLNTIVYNIRPAASDMVYSPIHLTSDECQVGMTVDVSDLQEGSAFTVRAGALKNITDENYSGCVSVALFSADNDFKTLLCEGKNLNLPSLQIVRYTDLSCYVPKDITVNYGDKVRLVTRDNTSDTWLPVANDLLTIGEVAAKGNVIPYYHINVPDADGAEITCRESKVIKGRDFSFHVAPSSPDKIVTVKANGFILTPEADCTYRINNVTADQDISIIVQNASDVVSKRNLWVQAGQLAELVGDSDSGTIRDLTLFGTIDANDFAFMRDRMKLTRLDISGVNIVANGSNPANAIPAKAFTKCGSLQQIILPDNVSTFKSGCFSYSGLTSIEIPASVATYEYNIFLGCASLSEVTVRRPSPAWINWCVFQGTPKTRLTVPVGSLSAYRSKEYWNDFNEMTEENATPATHYNVWVQEMTGVRFTRLSESSLVAAGADYEFMVETDDSYGDATMEVLANDTRISPDERGVYRVAINANTLVHADFHQPQAPSYDSPWKITGAAGGIGLVTDVVNVVPGKSFTIRANALAISPDDASKFYCAALTDSEGRIKELISPVMTNSSFNFGNLPCDFLCNVKDAAVREGNKIRIVTSSNKQRWNPVKGDNDSIIDCLSAIGNRVVYHNIEMPDKVEGAVIEGGATQVVRGMPLSLKVTPVSVDDRITIAVNGINKVVDAAIGRLSIPVVLEDLDIAIQVNPAGENAYTVVNVREGELAAKIEQCPSRLKVTGVMRSEDFDAFRNHAATIEELDLADVTVKGMVDFADAIPSNAFASSDAGVPSALKTVILPTNLVQIHDNAFNRCGLLSEVTIPATVNYVGSGAFAACAGLSRIICQGNQPPHTGNMSPFPSDCSGIILEVPGGSEDYYGNAAYWSDLMRVTSKVYYNIQIDPERTFSYNGYYSDLTKIEVNGQKVQVTLGLPNFTPLASKPNPTYRPGVAFRLYDNGNDVTTTSSYVCYGQHSVILDPDPYYQPGSARYPQDHIIKVVFHYPISIECMEGLSAELVDLSESDIWRSADMSLFIPGSTAYTNLFREGEDYKFKVVSSTPNIMPKVRCVSHNVTSFGDNPQFTDIESILVPDENSIYTISNLQGEVRIYVTADLVVGNGDVITPDEVALVSDEDASLLTDIGLDGEIDEATFQRIREKFDSLVSLDLSGITNESIPDNALMDMNSLRSVVIPEGVTSIGSEAFSGCSALESVTIPRAYSIGDNAFSGCRSMTSITLLGDPAAEGRAPQSAPGGVGRGCISESSFHDLNPNCLVYITESLSGSVGATPNVIINTNGTRITTSDISLDSAYPFNAPASFSLGQHSISIEMSLSGSLSDDNDCWKGIVLPFAPTAFELGEEFAPRRENPFTLLSFASVADDRLMPCESLEANIPYLASVYAPYDTVPVRFIATGQSTADDYVYDVPFTPAPEDIRTDGHDFTLLGTFDGSVISGNIYSLDSDGIAFRRVNTDSLNIVKPFETYLHAVSAGAPDSLNVGTHPVWVYNPESSIKSGDMLYHSSKVDFSTKTDGATVYYTLDGSEPTDTSIKYSEPFNMPGDSITVKAAAFYKGYGSETVSLDLELVKTHLDYVFNEGWSWISHNAETDVPVVDFMREGMSCVMSQSEEAVWDPQHGSTGNLNLLSPLKAYKVSASADNVSSTIKGISIDPYMPVAIDKGWNWMGFPLDHGSLALSDVFAGLNVEPGDMIVGRDGFSQVDSTGQWRGVLKIIEPGAGYMYLSGSDKEFVYGPRRSEEEVEGIPGDGEAVNEWKVDSRKYPSIMPVICRVRRDGTIVPCDEYGIAAFCGEECRGIGVVVEDWIMISVFGNAGDEIGFRIYSEASDTDMRLKQSFIFTEDAVGSLASPFVFDYNSTSLGDMVDDTLTITVEDGILIFNDAMRQASLAEVYDLTGRRLASKDVTGMGRVSLGRLVSGVYVVMLHTSTGCVSRKIEVR